MLAHLPQRFYLLKWLQLFLCNLTYIPLFFSKLLSFVFNVLTFFTYLLHILASLPGSPRYYNHCCTCMSYVWCMWLCIVVTVHSSWLCQFSKNETKCVNLASCCSLGMTGSGSAEKIIPHICKILILKDEIYFCIFFPLGLFHKY